MQPLFAATFALAWVGALAPPLAQVLSDADRLRPAWEQLDQNRDGRVTFDELPEGLGAYMRGNDANGDGALSLEEYVAFDRDPGNRSGAPLPANVRQIEGLPYAGTADPRQQVDVYLPRERSVSGPLPVIAYVHGGGWRLGSRVMAKPQVAPLVNSGRYAAVSIGYRLSWQSKWPAQIHDVKAGIRWIRAHAEEYGFDPTRICVMGSSAGGHLSAQVGTTNGAAAVEGELGPHLEASSDVQCAIDLFGPTDLHETHRVRGEVASMVEDLLGGAPERVPEAAREASPVVHVDPSDPPFMLIHGTRDATVPFAESVALDAALRRAGVPVVFQVIEGGGHGDFFSPEIARRIQLFLERTFYDPTVTVPAEPIQFVATGS